MSSIVAFDFGTHNIGVETGNNVAVRQKSRIDRSRNKEQGNQE